MDTGGGFENYHGVGAGYSPHPRDGKKIRTATARSGAKIQKKRPLDIGQEQCPDSVQVHVQKQPGNGQNRPDKVLDRNPTLLYIK